MYDPNFLSILPSIIAIILAITTRQVIVSLGVGIWLGNVLLNDFNLLIGLASGIESIIGVFMDPSDTKVLVFTLVIGGLITTIEQLGGVSGLVDYLNQKTWVNTPTKAKWLAYLIGVFIFIESNITLLIAGAVARPLFDKFKIAREKLAYIIDSTSSPICIMIPFNAWGALIIGLAAASNIDNPLEVFVYAIPFNLYPIIVILFSAFVILFNINLGPMRQAQEDLSIGAHSDTVLSDEYKQEKAKAVGQARYMLIPIISLVVAMPVSLYITGNGNIIEGSGSTSVLWSVLFALASCWAIALSSRKSNLDFLMRHFLKGAGDFLPISVILLFALTLGDVAGSLGAGTYVSAIARDTVNIILLLPILFILSAVIAFSIGSSWGTFAIMIPIALQIALELDSATSLFLAAVLSGSVFGDHSSPISDTTVVASLASGSDHIEHVRTQLPYALICAALACGGFFLLGMIAL